MSFSLAVLLFATALVVVVEAEDFIIELPDGKIRGTNYTTSNNFQYYGYRGIPYAQPPIDDLRFEPPEPVEPWGETIWDATSDGQSCISTVYFDKENPESEDCLYINVYTPIYEITQYLPVMVWIYGGGYVQGTSNKELYGPDFLVEQQVVVVSFNYRLAAFGFLSTGDLALPGNQAIKDQLLALKWVRDNIEYFGGDPDQVTIFGGSAGAVSVGLHVVSPKSTGLFRAAIQQSGSVLNGLAILQDPANVAFQLAELIPSNETFNNDTSLLKDFLKSRSVDEIVNATINLPQGSRFTPVIEPPSDDAFLTESPYQLLESGQFNQVPLIMGMTAEESLNFLIDLDTAKAAATSAEDTPKSLIPVDLYSNASVEAEVIDAIKNIYLEENETFVDNLLAFAQYTSDDMFVRGIMKQAELIAAQDVPVYFYQFSYFGRTTFVPFLDGAEKATHGAELMFILIRASVSGTNETEDLAVQNEIVQLWTSFAKTLEPTSDTDAGLWPQFDGLTYLNINATSGVKTDLKAKSYPAWKAIFEAYGRKPFVTF